MSDDELILAIDQGTTSSRAILFSHPGAIEAASQYEFTQIFPNDGWVEHDPEEIWATTLKAIKDVLTSESRDTRAVTAVGITNQRETIVVWDRETGQPVYNAIVWQDRRTASVCREIEAAGHLETIRSKTGLLLDPYFSATKVAWILDNVAGARERAAEGKLAFGTIDSFLIWRLTSGRVHATDATNASRTSLFDIRVQQWDEELLKIFDVPANMLPDVKDCADDYGHADASVIGESIAIQGVAGDQQAAAIGQCCFAKGSLKSTYGTGCFALVNTGDKMVLSSNRLLSTVAYRLNGETTYALEGSIFIAGAAIQWLRDGIGIIESAEQSEVLASSIETGEGVTVVPAFTGLGAPYWDPDARAAILGMTRATSRAEIVRATLQSICFQTHDLLAAMHDDGVKVAALKVDGGMVANNWFSQYLADLLQLEIDRPQVMETTALGAAYLAGLQAGIYKSFDDIAANWKLDRSFQPSGVDNSVQLSRWSRAVAAVRAFAEV